LFFFTFLYGFIYYTQEFRKPELTAYIINLSLFIAAFFTLYIHKLLDRKPGFRFTYFLYFTPYLLTSLFLIVAYSLSGKDKNGIGSFFDFLHQHRSIHNFFQYINIIVGPVYLLIIIILFKQHKRNLLQVFSSDKKTNLMWIKIIIIVAFALWFITVLISKIGLKILFPHFMHAYEITWGFSSFLFVYLTYQGFKHSTVFFELPEEQITKPADKSKTQKYERSGLKESDFEDLAQKVLSYTQDKKPYLNSELTIYEFASGVGVPAYTISQLLSEHFKQNFCDFINHHRITEFKKQVLLPENKNYSIQAVAFDCGFNSKSTFNRIFKKFTNTTPSTYIEEQMKARQQI